MLICDWKRYSMNSLDPSPYGKRWEPGSPLSYGYEKMGNSSGKLMTTIDKHDELLGFERSEINNLQLRLCDAFFKCGK